MYKNRPPIQSIFYKHISLPSNCFSIKIDREDNYDVILSWFLITNEPLENIKLIVNNIELKSVPFTNKLDFPEICTSLLKKDIDIIVQLSSLLKEPAELTLMVGNFSKKIEKDIYYEPIKTTKTMFQFGKNFYFTELDFKKAPKFIYLKLSNPSKIKLVQDNIFKEVDCKDIFLLSNCFNKFEISLYFTEEQNPLEIKYEYDNWMIYRNEYLTLLF